MPQMGADHHHRATEPSTVDALEYGNPLILRLGVSLPLVVMQVLVSRSDL